jgi:REP-associated tyrosine transposase
VLYRILIEWRWSDYNEIQNPKHRYAIINYRRLTEILGIESLDILKKIHSQWIEESLQKDRLIREEKWSQCIAVGNKKYIEHIKDKLGVRAIHRQIHENSNDFELREDQTPYTADFDTETTRLSQKNTYYWSNF